jgi:protein TonB
LSPGAANDPAEATDPGVPNPSTLAPPATLGKVPPVTVPPVVPSDLLLSRIHYPTLARTQGVEATVVLELSIDEAGRIGEVTVVQDPGWGFAAEARRALVGLLCEPALVDGVPVAVRYRYPIRFSLH